MGVGPAHFILLLGMDEMQKKVRQRKSSSVVKYDPEEERKIQKQRREVPLNTEGQGISCQVAEV